MVSKPIVATWKALSKGLQARISKESFDTWFKHLDVSDWSNGSVRLVAPNRYVKQWIESHYLRELLDAAREIHTETRKVEIIALPPKKTVKPATPVGSVLRGSLPSSEASSPANRYRSSGSGWRGSQAYRLDNFVVAAGNRLAFTACESIVESPDTMYNPLVLHGSHGLGKTHLLQGLAHAFQQRTPNSRIRLVSCEEFANAYINAIKAKTLEEFRADYRRSHVLLVDDVQFLSGKEKTQHELLHTFDALRNLGRQVVLTSTVHPRDIPRLSEGLKARLQSGLVARIDAPAFEARVDLLIAKARIRGMNLSRELAEVLAHRVECCVRELEGVVCKLGALCAAEGVSANKRLVLRALCELGYLRDGPLSLEEILDSIVQHSQVSADDIRSSRRHTTVVRARHIGMFLSKMLTEFSLGEIGRFYGNRDHSTVLHAHRKIESKLNSDPALQSDIEALKRRLGR